MNKSILALTLAASFAAFAPSAQAGSWYDGYGYYGGHGYSGRTCVNEDGEYYRCRRVYRDSALPSIPGLPGSVQRKMENLLGISGGGGCRRWSNSRQAWVRTSCD